MFTNRKSWMYLNIAPHLRLTENSNFTQLRAQTNLPSPFDDILGDENHLHIPQEIFNIWANSAPVSMPMQIEQMCQFDYKTTRHITAKRKCTLYVMVYNYDLLML